jgi:hypothetical protein
MKRVVITSMILAMVCGLGTAFGNPEGTPDAKRLFTLNIIGVTNPKNINMDQGSGKVIFVNFEEPSQINLVCSDDEEVLATYPDLEAGDFAVLDKDATTGKKQEDPSPGAILALPSPGLEAYNTDYPDGKDTLSEYSLYIRPLGGPGGSAAITTCAELLDSNFAGLLSGKFVSLLNRDGVFGGKASVEQVSHEMNTRPQGKSIFTDVTAELLTIVFKVEVEVQADEDTNGDGVVDENDTEIIIEYVRVPIFDNLIQGEYWEYDNDGLKLLQVWIYDKETDVSEGDDVLS